jgi:hypothetical protein
MISLEVTETIRMQTLQLTMMHPKKTAHNKLKLPLRCSQSLSEITSLHALDAQMHAAKIDIQQI